LALCVHCLEPVTFNDSIEVRTLSEAELLKLPHAAQRKLWERQKDAEKNS